MLRNYNVRPDCQVPNLGNIYNHYFKNIDVGYFVEVGAYDGVSWSNTLCLAEVGWKGIYIEPITHHINMCKANHSKHDVIIEQCAIGPLEETKMIYCAGGLSTLDDEVRNVHEILYNQVNLQKETINIVPLNKILRKHNAPKNFEVLVVDTEGFEKEVFDSFSFDEYRPKMLIVELNDVHGGYIIAPEVQAKSKQVRTYIESNDYVEIYLDAINTIFIDKHEQF